MSTTPTLVTADTLARALNQAQPGQIPDVLRRILLGRMLDPVKITIAAGAFTAIAGLDITTLKKGGTGVTINSGLADLATNDPLPAIQAVKTLRVTTSGTANSVGTYAVGDVGSTPLTPTAGANVGLATLSDDGKTLTFPTTVTGLVLEYIPRPAEDMANLFAPFPTNT